MSGVVIFGCKSTTRYLYRSLRGSCDIAGIVTIAPELGASQEVVDYDDLRDLEAEVSVYNAEKYSLKSEGDLAHLAKLNADLGLAIGWQRLIPEQALASFRRGVFGMHGSSQNLPFGRGRSPLNWSIIEGRKWFHTNLFRYLPGTDDGPVAATGCFSIQPNDTAETLHFKNLLTMISLLRENVPAMLAGTLQLRPQPDGQATYYPKREPSDGIIDWGADVFALDRHIRAVAPPFGGAFSFVGGTKLTVDAASIFYTDVEDHPFVMLEPGTICAVMPNGKFCVRCVGGVLLVHRYEVEGGSEIDEGDRLHSPAEAIRSFARNRFGNFDLPGRNEE